MFVGGTGAGGVNMIGEGAFNVGPHDDKNGAVRCGATIVGGLLIYVNGVISCEVELIDVDGEVTLVVMEGI